MKMKEEWNRFRKKVEGCRVGSMWHPDIMFSVRVGTLLRLLNDVDRLIESLSGVTKAAKDIDRWVKNSRSDDDVTIAEARAFMMGLACRLERIGREK